MNGASLAGAAIRLHGLCSVCDVQPCPPQTRLRRRRRAYFNPWSSITPEGPKVYMRAVIRARVKGSSVQKAIQDAQAEVTDASSTSPARMRRRSRISLSSQRLERTGG